jgi:hypothetical protein
VAIDDNTARFVADHEGEWIKAQDIPERCANMLVWKWHRSMIGPPELSIVPRGYSRDPLHCDGWYYMLATIPLPPDLPKSTT